MASLAYNPAQGLGFTTESRARMADLEDIARKLKKRSRLSGYGPNIRELRAVLEQAKAKPDEPASEPEPQPTSAVTSPKIASEAAALMHHEDPAVRRVAASAVRQAEGRGE